MYPCCDIVTHTCTYAHVHVHSILLEIVMQSATENYTQEVYVLLTLHK